MVLLASWTSRSSSWLWFHDQHSRPYFYAGRPYFRRSRMPNNQSNLFIAVRGGPKAGSERSKSDDHHSNNGDCDGRHFRYVDPVRDA